MTVIHKTKAAKKKKKTSATEICKVFTVKVVKGTKGNFHLPIKKVLNNNVDESLLLKLIDDFNNE